jgi:adenylate cyclase
MTNFFREFRRRNVHKVTVVYLLLGWLAIDLAWIFFPMMDAPGLLKFFIIIVALGFPIALIIGWRFEMTPTGMKRTDELSPNETIPYWSKKKFGAFVISVALLDIVLLIVQCVRT